MTEHLLQSPLSREAVLSLRAGDLVYLDGIVFGIRDATLIRIFDRGMEPPVSLQGASLLHTAPSVRKVGDRYEPICIGTTTSMRMDRFTGPLLERYGIRAILGKGGLSEASVRLMEQHGACYLAIVGGAASLQTTQIEEIEAVYWEDLMPECLWKIRYKGLGPLTVGIDAHGNSLYAEVSRQVEERRLELYERLGVA
ncbi:MAG: FumA C-terminus/TtdB family hydratase beta subunit [Anaerolineae bacterium]